MPSPFPGMNPWLEQPDVWHDFHQAFLAAARTALAEQIRPAYIAKIDENVYIHELSADQSYLLGRPDVGVFQNAAPPRIVPSQANTASTPIAISKLLPATERLCESFIEIRDRESRDLITVIELLSPTNKTPGPDRDLYLAKRRLLTTSNVHFVELDLLRGGLRMPVEQLPECDYLVMVSRSHERPHVGLWPTNLHTPLPRIPVPLKPEHTDAVLDLQQLLHTTFDSAGYSDYIYQGSPRPPLDHERTAWASTWLSKPS
jgi:hypothetical protein